MATAIVTGAAGLVGGEAVRQLTRDGFNVVGIDNDMRARFFGPQASTAPSAARLEAECDGFRLERLDVRDRAGIELLVRSHRRSLALVVHTAAQPSHDWAAREPHIDFEINALGTLHLLEAVRVHQPSATFVFTSTNKVYGDLPNELPLIDVGRRLDVPADHPYYDGIPTAMPIDRSNHSLFGVSKASADLLVQEYGRAFGIPTACFRAGCVTGGGHAGTELHGFLSYLMRCTVRGTPYTVHGYEGKQVRDNLHAADLVAAFRLFHGEPRAGAVYNIGGGRDASLSVLEAIELCEQIAGRTLEWSRSPVARRGDHRWWISANDEFRMDFPAFRVTRDIDAILREIHQRLVEDG